MDRTQAALDHRDSRPWLPIAWVEGSPLRQGKASFAAGVLEETLVVAGGTYWQGGAKHWTSDVELYDPAADRWRPGPSLPCPLAYGAFACGSGEGLEVYGGGDGERASTQTIALAEPTGTWRVTGQVPAPRLLARAERVDGRTYLLGGTPDIGQLHSAVDEVLVRQQKGAWRPESRLPDGPRFLMATAVLDGGIYVFGGSRADGPRAVRNLRDAHRYDPRTGRWQRLADLPYAVRGLTATVAGRRHIYLFGGYAAASEAEAEGSPDRGYLRQGLVYDTDADTYERTTDLPRPAMLLDLFWSRGRLCGAGGETMTDTTSFGRSHRTCIGHPSGASPAGGKPAGQ